MYILFQYLYSPPHHTTHHTIIQHTTLCSSTPHHVHFTTPARYIILARNPSLIHDDLLDLPSEDKTEKILPSV